jgi:hypothetical protein
MFDDIIFVLKAERFQRGESDRLDLYRFITSDEEGRALRDRGTIPWWTTTAARIDFFRPLPEWLFYLDLKLFGRRPAAHRLVSLAWFALALLALHRLYLTAGGDSARAGLATGLFGVSQSVALPATWICNRCDMLAVVGIALAARAYWSACDRPSWRRGIVPQSSILNPQSSIVNSTSWRLIIAAVAAFAFALLSKESALILAVVVGAHELLARLRRWPLGGGRVRARIAVFLAIAAGVYLAYYLGTRPWLFGAGEGGGGALSMLSRFPKALPIYLSVWTLGYPIVALLDSPAWHVNAVVVTSIVAALVVIRYLRKSIRNDRAAPFFLLWTLLFLALALLAIPDARALCPATIGWVYLLAGLLLPARHRPAAAPTWVRHWLLTTNGIVSIACGIGTLAAWNSFECGARRCIGRYVAAQDPPLSRGDTLIVAEAEHPLHLVCAGDRFEYLTGLKNVAFSYITVAGCDLTIEREDDHTLLLTSPTSLFRSPAHRIALEPDWQPHVGRVFELTNFTARLAAVENHDAVTAIRLRFAQPLASPELHFYPPQLAAIAHPAAGPPAAPTSGPAATQP